MSGINFSFKRVIQIGLCAAVLLLSGTAYAQQNPFLSGGSSGDSPSSAAESGDAGAAPPDAETPQPSAPKASASGIVAGGGEPKQQSRFLQLINEFQRQLYGRIAGAMQAVKQQENRGSVLFIALAAAFLYGLLHALGPGHRKTVIFSYFLAEGAPVLHGVAAGVLMAALHGAAAVLLILPIYYILRGSLLITFNSVSRYIELATFGFIAVFGAVMLTLHLVQLLRGAHGHAHRHSAAPGEPEELQYGAGQGTGSGRTGRRNMLLLIIGSSLVPCPGAAMVLMFALSMQMTALGLMAVGAMSLGMAVTISAVAVVTLGARATLNKSVAKNHKLTSVLHTTLELGGYMVIFVFGLLMTIGGL